IRSLPMLKCSSDRCVCAPQSLSAGTLTSPRLSVSLRTSVTAHLIYCGAATFLVVDATALRRPAHLGLHPRLGLVRRFADQLDQTGQRFLAIAQLAAMALGHQHQYALAGKAAPREALEPLPH